MAVTSPTAVPTHVPTHVLKHVPEDFLVRENLVVPLTADGPYRYLLLRKRGLTTSEAVRLLARHTGLEPGEVAYAGLKDEDGVTEQLVSVPAAAPLDGDVELAEPGGGTLRATHHGHGAEPLVVGGLNGNGFRVVVRDLDESIATALATAGRINLLFVNYYDTQRFGVPGGPKRTHLVGAALNAGDPGTALRELAGLAAPESPAAAAWTGDSGAFFRSLDPRTVAFYRSAHSSAQWNAQVREVVAAECGDRAVEATVDGLSYLLPVDDAGAARVQGVLHELDYVRHVHRAGPVQQVVPRPVVVQAVVALHAAGPDPEFPGRFAACAQFQLPTGCYATAALRQLLLRVRPLEAP
uniref:TruD-like protein n=1 Tax=Actinomyces sp. Lu 9419 TaxID=416175 RepID=B5SP78_9ACTO|nr:TruD-like protein [Actinomyces sp. Lu 9419]